MAIDTYGNTLTYNGTSWSAPSSAGESLSWVSCPAINFCIAVASGFAVIYNGTNWSAPKLVDAGTLTTVSCPTTTFCMAVDATGYALTYNGLSWSVPKNVGAGPSVSCASKNFCVTVDHHGNALKYNGSKWSSPTSIDPGIFSSLSCPTASFCMAVDTSGNASYLQRQEVVSTYEHGRQHSRLSIMFYEEVLYGGRQHRARNRVFGSRNWSTPAKIDPYGGLGPVSCPTTGFCAAVDDSGNALTYDNQNALEITGISPTFGPSSGGTSVTINGNNFTPSAGVDFGSTPASSVVVRDSKTIIATSPPGTGTVDVTVTTSAGTSMKSAFDEFNYGQLTSIQNLVTLTGLNVIEGPCKAAFLLQNDCFSIQQNFFTADASEQDISYLIQNIDQFQFSSSGLQVNMQLTVFSCGGTVGCNSDSDVVTVNHSFGSYSTPLPTTQVPLEFDIGSQIAAGSVTLLSSVTVGGIVKYATSFLEPLAGLSSSSTVAPNSEGTPELAVVASASHNNSNPSEAKFGSDTEGIVQSFDQFLGGAMVPAVFEYKDGLATAEKAKNLNWSVPSSPPIASNSVSFGYSAGATDDGVHFFP